MILRLLGLVYLMAFLTLALQGTALLGPHGLLPLGEHLDAIAAALGSRAAGFRALPSVFWLGAGAGALRGVGWVGVALSAGVLLGFANGLVLAVAVRPRRSRSPPSARRSTRSAGSCSSSRPASSAASSCPFLDGRPFPRRAPSEVTVWLLRLLAVRIMLGAFLIKIRGDSCWRAT